MLMHVQGIPTTRAGSIITSDSRVTRDAFYSGNPQQERCSIVMRVAPTFLRFGSFEIFKATDPTTGTFAACMQSALQPALPCLPEFCSANYGFDLYGPMDSLFIQVPSS